MQNANKDKAENDVVLEKEDNDMDPEKKENECETESVFQNDLANLKPPFGDQKKN